VLFLLIVRLPGVAQLFFDLGYAVFTLVGGSLPFAEYSSRLMFWR
jgi:hypothetical protein